MSWKFFWREIIFVDTMDATDEWSNYATICRLCLQRDGFMLGIFNHIQGKEKSIYKKIIDCTALEVNILTLLTNYQKSLPTVYYRAWTLTMHFLWERTNYKLQRDELIFLVCSQDFCLITNLTPFCIVWLTVTVKRSVLRTLSTLRWWLPNLVVLHILLIITLWNNIIALHIVSLYYCNLLSIVYPCYLLR